MGTLEGHCGRPPAMVFLSNGQLLVSPFSRYFASFWDPLTDFVRGIMKDQFFWASPITFSPNGRYIASALVQTCAIEIWDTLTRTT